MLKYQLLAVYPLALFMSLSFPQAIQAATTVDRNSSPVTVPDDNSNSDIFPNDEDFDNDQDFGQDQDQDEDQNQNQNDYYNNNETSQDNSNNDSKP